MEYEFDYDDLWEISYDNKLYDDVEYVSGWYEYRKRGFEYNGKKYEFKYREHTSPNVCDKDIVQDPVEITERDDEDDECKDKLVEALHDYFGFDTPHGTYYYVLTRDKEAFHYGMMNIDDWKEIDDDFVHDLAEFIIEFQRKQKEGKW